MRNSALLSAAALFFVFLAVSPFVLAAVDDADNDAFNLDDYLITDESQIGDYDPYIHTIDGTSKDDEQGLFKTSGISPEMALEVEKIKDITRTSIAILAVLIVIAALASLRNVSGIALIILVVVIVIVAGALVTVVFTNQNMFTQAIYGNSEAQWGNVTIGDFNLKELDDMDYQYDHSATLAELEQMIAISDTGLTEDDIVGVKQYAWSEGAVKRETIIIEFVDNDKLRAFVKTIFTPLREFRVQKEDLLWGELTSSNDDYANPYIMEENRFLFLIYGPEEYAQSAASKIVDYYPSVYQYTNDEEPPTIEVQEPMRLYTNDDSISFTVFDKASGMHPLSIAVTGLDGGFDPIFSCEKTAASYDAFSCEKDDVLIDGSHSFTIYATDRENNLAKQQVDYILDTEKPSIQLYDDKNEDELIFDVTDNQNLSAKNVILRSGTQEIRIDNSCAVMPHKLVCRVDIASYLKQGKATIDIVATDNAGNQMMERITTLIDTLPPTVRILDNEEGFIRDDTFEFLILDDASGINDATLSVIRNGDDVASYCSRMQANRYICRIPVTPGENIFSVTVSDFKGNELAESFTAQIDTDAPDVEMLNYDIGEDGYVRFRVWDDVSGIALDEISINGNYFEVPSICEPVSIYYYCEYSLDTRSHLATITLSDVAGNLAVKRIELP